MTAPVPNRAHYPALDGLRGIAILLVLLLHNLNYSNYFFFGWLGVDLFFVLSGFLITDILIRTVGQPRFLKHFYVRRVLRIFPLYYLILFLTLIVLPLTGNGGLDTRYYTTHQGWFWSYLQNWLFIFREPTGDKILLHTWSLAVEEQFYLLWPLIILLLRRPRRLLFFMLFVLIATGLVRYAVWEARVQDLAYASLYTFTRIDGLCIGSMVALLQHVNPRFLERYTGPLVLLMAGINFGFYFINRNQGLTLPYLAFAGYTTFAVLFGLLVYEVVNKPSRWIHWTLGNPVFRFLGRISYGLYVYHWPVYVLLFDPLYAWLLQYDLSPALAQLSGGALLTGLALLISMASYAWFEKPFLRLKERFA